MYKKKLRSILESGNHLNYSQEQLGEVGLNSFKMKLNDQYTKVKLVMKKNQENSNQQQKIKGSNLEKAQLNQAKEENIKNIIIDEKEIIVEEKTTTAENTYTQKLAIVKINNIFQTRSQEILQMIEKDKQTNLKNYNSRRQKNSKVFKALIQRKTNKKIKILKIGITLNKLKIYIKQIR